MSLYVPVADNKYPCFSTQNGRFAYFIPVSGNFGHFFHCPTMNNYCVRFSFNQMRNPFFRNNFVISDTCFYGNRQTTSPPFGLTDYFFGKFRIANKSCATIVFNYFSCRTTHINIYTVKTKLHGKSSTFIKIFRVGSKKLCYDRPFIFFECQMGH